MKYVLNLLVNVEKVKMMPIFLLFFLQLISLNLHESITDIWANQYYPLVFQLFVFSLGFFLLLKTFNQSQISFNVLDVLIISYLGYSFVNAILRTGNLAHANNAYMQLCYLCLYFIVKFYTKNFTITSQLILAMVAMASLQMFWGLFQFTVAPITSPVNGSFVNSGLYGGYLASIFPLLFWLKKYYPKYTLLFIFLMVIIVVAVVLCKSRAAYIAIIISLLLVNVDFKRMKLIGPIPKALLLFSAIGIMVFGAYKLYQIRPASVDGRLVIWKVGIQMAEKSIVFGSGNGFVFNNYNAAQGEYFEANTTTEVEENVVGQTYSVFNEFLRIVIEEGIIGLSLFLSILIVLFRTSFRRGHKFIFMGVISFVIFSLASYPFSIQANTVIFYALIAILSNNGSIRFKQMNSPNIKIVPIAIICFMVVNICDTLFAIKKWQYAKRLLYYNEAKSLSDYHDIKASMINNHFFIYNYGATLADLGQFREALSVLLSCKNTSISLYSQIGRCYENLNQHEMAEIYYRKSTFIMPNALNPKDLLFSFYKKTHQIEKAKLLALEILNTPIKIYTKRAVDISNNAWLYLYQQQ